MIYCKCGATFKKYSDFLVHYHIHVPLPISGDKISKEKFEEFKKRRAETILTHQPINKK